jgi:hypothetical protein
MTQQSYQYIALFFMEDVLIENYLLLILTKDIYGVVLIMKISTRNWKELLTLIFSMIL